ncbi:stress 70 protein chaperone microsome-associated 60 kDa protein precursor, putative [Entamoeba dispar SAW760]|uniref:Stress 70 protein chaperone microsome-associated 60 kDa protein, putative n=1 Tax=Entamoeba dispar (strain ATCC PRA-260 / SAW760) TaxID=370354 RepID=B0ERZ1_ENTDS|nr:stress 70 protein chaperone microsome-associated 60 kDa protein precursor, putative [Entamoeba dispar SAW760]EDR22706.1 stress 70 protein chaperone microsome-associated 60 kDa protein precursor, putative [Entamoeba dispar SAW760]|eukprot:EDR22706.1 stress 70 protein chaperone microsome-associated 60 kDa protein precursor, putative [Entamoeba dispar SAW760]
MAEDLFIGIDFGTTYSSIAYCIGKTGKIETIKDENSEQFIPSTMEIVNDREIIVGANPLKETEERQILSDSKTFLGKRLQGIQKEQKFIEKGGELWYRVNGSKKIIAVKTVAQSILKKLKDLYCEKLKIDKNTIINPVITIPAGFNQKQRKTISQIAQEINIKPIFVHEPTAAALYYLDTTKDKIEKPTKLLVFDFGGGTLDITCIEMKLNTEGKFVFDILCTNGNNELGGNNFDDNLYNMIIEKIDKDYNIESSTLNSEIKTSLRKRAINAKHELSKCDETTILISDLISFNSENSYNIIFEDNISEDSISEDSISEDSISEDSISEDVTIKITRKYFDDINSSEYQKAMKLLDDALDMAKLKSIDIDKVLLVGGSSYIPKVKELIQEKFGKEKIIQGIDPLTAVVLGAVVCSREKSITINEVLPKDIKIERFDGTTITIFKANEKLPLKKTIPITPSEDNVDSIKVSLYEGNYSVASMNDLIDEIVFSNLAKVSIEEAYIEITFECDRSGTLKITVIDFNNCFEQKVHIRCKLKFEEKQELLNPVEEHLKFINEDNKNFLDVAIIPVDSEETYCIGTISYN